MKAYEIRLYPNKSQEKQINQTIGNCRWYWNYLLSHVIEHKKKYKNYDNFVNPTPKSLKSQFEWLSLGSYCSLAQVQRDLVHAMKNIKKMGTGFPKFKKKKNKNSYRECQIGIDGKAIEIKESKLKLSKLGIVRFKTSSRYTKELQTNKIINCTISKTSTGKYFASVLCKVEIEQKSKIDSKIGIDLGLKSFYTDSNNNTIQNPRFFQKSQEKLAFQQRILSRKKLYSKNWYKQNKKVNSIHEKIKNQRSFFLHNLSTKLINENQVICLEDLNVEGMMKNKKLAKSIADVSWSEFVRQLEYKASWYGREIQKISTFFPSSKTCSRCGTKKEKLELNERTFKCDVCGLEIDRDYNASLNILKQCTDQSSGINASGVGSLEPTMKEENLAIARLDYNFVIEDTGILIKSFGVINWN